MKTDILPQVGILVVTKVGANGSHVNLYFGGIDKVGQLRSTCCHSEFFDLVAGGDLNKEGHITHQKFVCFCFHAHILAGFHQMSSSIFKDVGAVGAQGFYLGIIG